MFPFCISYDYCYLRKTVNVEKNAENYVLFRLQTYGRSFMAIKSVFFQNIDLNQEMELFYNISNSALSVLVHDVESTCDAALQAMVKKK